MPHPFDATAKYLIEAHPADWLALSGRQTSGRVELVEAELSTVTAAADKVLVVHDEPAWVLHLEPQVHTEEDLAGRVHLYNALLGCKFGLPVWTVVVLLGPGGYTGELTGELRRSLKNGEPPYLLFRYQVVRVWELSPDTFLTGGVGIVPLAAISDVDPNELPAVIRRMEERINLECRPGETGQIWTAVGVLMGLVIPVPDPARASRSL